jgi:hypothetical protein
LGGIGRHGTHWDGRMIKTLISSGALHSARRQGPLSTSSGPDCPGDSEKAWPAASSSVAAPVAAAAAAVAGT